MARDATERFISVIKVSNSDWHTATKFGCFEAIRFMTLRAAYLLTGFAELVAS